MDLLAEQTIQKAEQQLEHYCKIEGQYARAIIAIIKDQDREITELKQQIEAFKYGHNPKRLSE